VTSFLNRFATPLTLGLFAVSAISGLALFFHLAQGAFHEMHEWLSVLLLLPFALHVWKNWPALIGYVRRGTLLLPVAAALVAAIAFAVPAMTGAEGGDPRTQVLRLLTGSSLADLAPLLKTTPDALAATLRLRGYKVGSPSDTLEGVAAASGASPRELLLGLLPPR
jgi:hypothetical protein